MYVLLIQLCGSMSVSTSIALLAAEERMEEHGGDENSCQYYCSGVVVSSAPLALEVTPLFAAHFPHFSLSKFF